MCQTKIIMFLPTWGPDSHLLQIVTIVSIAQSIFYHIDNVSQIQMPCVLTVLVFDVSFMLSSVGRFLE